MKIGPLRRAFRRILASDYGPTLQKALQLYKTVAIPAIFYGLEAWFNRDRCYQDRLSGD